MAEVITGFKVKDENGVEKNAQVCYENGVCNKPNFKTVGGQSIVGEGDIPLPEGSSYDDTELREEVADKAAAVHGHNIADVEGLTEGLNGKASELDLQDLREQVNSITPQMIELSQAEYGSYTGDIALLNAMNANSLATGIYIWKKTNNGVIEGYKVVYYAGSDKAYIINVLEPQNTAYYYADPIFSGEWVVKSKPYKIGDLSWLATDDKTDLVAAINEVFYMAQSGGGGASYDDTELRNLIADETARAEAAEATLGNRITECNDTIEAVNNNFNQKLEVLDGRVSALEAGGGGGGFTPIEYEIDSVDSDTAVRFLIPTANMNGLFCLKMRETETDHDVIFYVSNDTTKVRLFNQIIIGVFVDIRVEINRDQKEFIATIQNSDDSGTFNDFSNVKLIKLS